MPLPSELDNAYHAMIRARIDMFLRAAHHMDTCSNLYDILEIGPSRDIELNRGPGWHTLDINPGCTYEADICDATPIPASTYDVVLCMEVLEHTVAPWDALCEIRRILKPGGLLIASAPFNVREHGPLPDAWRFTRHGWKILLRNWDDVQLDVLMTPGRPLMPLHINASARCNKDKRIEASELTFEKQES